MRDGPGRGALVARWLMMCAVVIAVSGGAGALIGVGLSKLTGDDKGAGATVASTGESGADASTTAGAPAAPAPVSLRVIVRDAVLHPASTPAGMRRKRARLTVRITAQNRGETMVTPARPVLLAAGTRTPTDPQADGPGTKLGALAPGKSASVTLRFETAGTVTAQLNAQRHARVVVGGRSVGLRVALGNPVPVGAEG